MNEELWEEYAEVRRTQGRAAAARFCLGWQVMTDAGAQVAWPARFDAGAGEVSAVQHATNLRPKVGPEAFAAEYQNEPALPQVSAIDGRWPFKIDSKPG